MKEIWAASLFAIGLRRMSLLVKLQTARIRNPCRESEAAATILEAKCPGEPLVHATRKQLARKLLALPCLSQ
jgi:hypothetical protein